MKLVPVSYVRICFHKLFALPYLHFGLCFCMSPSICFFDVVRGQIDNFRLIGSHLLRQLLGEEVVVAIDEVTQHNSK